MPRPHPGGSPRETRQAVVPLFSPGRKPSRLHGTVGFTNPLEPGLVCRPSLWRHWCCLLFLVKNKPRHSSWRSSQGSRVIFHFNLVTCILCCDGNDRSLLGKASWQRDRGARSTAGSPQTVLLDSCTDFAGNCPRQSTAATASALSAAGFLCQTKRVVSSLQPPNIHFSGRRYSQLRSCLAARKQIGESFLMRTPSHSRVTPSQGTFASDCHSTCTVSSSLVVPDHHDGDAGGNIYVRAWQFVQRRLHLRPRAASCPADMEAAKEQKSAPVEPVTISSSYCADWQRVHLLKELEEAGQRAQWRRQQQQCRAKQESIQETAEWTPSDEQEQPTFRTRAQRKVFQVTCTNCGLLFFRPLSVALDASAYCSRDCQSTFEYLRDLQEIVNDRDTFESPVSWTKSSSEPAKFL